MDEQQTKFRWHSCSCWHLVFWAEQSKVFGLVQFNQSIQGKQVNFEWITFQVKQEQKNFQRRAIQTLSIVFVVFSTLILLLCVTSADWLNNSNFQDFHLRSRFRFQRYLIRNLIAARNGGEMLVNEPRSYWVRLDATQN